MQDERKTKRQLIAELAELRRRLAEKAAGAEQALEDTEDTFTMFAEQSPNMVFVNRQGRIVYANRRCEETMGYSRDEFYAPDFDLFALIAPQDREMICENLTRHMRGEEIAPCEYSLLTKSGERIEALITTKLIDYRDENAILGIVTDITAQKRTEEKLQQRVKEMAILNALGRQVSSALSREKVAAIVLENAVKATTPDLAVLYLRRGDTLVLQGVFPDNPVFHTPEVEVKQVGQCLCGLAAGEGKPVYSRDIRADPRCTLDECTKIGGRSFAALPLLVDHTVLGVLGLVAFAEADFGQQADFLQALAAQTATALHNALLHEQVQQHAGELERRVAEATAVLERRNAQLQVAAEVARDANAAADLDTLMNRAVGLIRERFGFYHVGIFLTDAREEYAVLHAATNEAGRQMIEQGHRLEVDAVGIVGHVASTGEPRIALDVCADAEHLQNPLLSETRSEMALPLRIGERTIGVLDVQSTEESAFDEHDVETLQTVADQLAGAIERTRLFERIQAALEERLHTVISNAPIVLFALDRDGVFTLSEGKGLEALGVKPGEHVGQSVFDVYRSLPDVVASVRRALDGEAVAPIIDIGGVMFETWYTPLRDERGEVGGVIGVATDVTERERLQEQVRQQERLAAVGQLAGGIAHDFNNYLTTIMLYAQILLRARNLPPELAQNARTILDESQRAVHLVQQILDFSRRSMMESKPVDLAPLTEEIVSILRRTFPEDIHLSVQIGAGDLVANADPTRIQQMVMNLALNARDAMPQGGDLRIGLSLVETRSGEKPPKIKALPEDVPGGTWICMSISDTGTGMTEEVQAHLFEPFFTTKGAEGTGLGLAQVHGIVKQHQGYIGVETGLGEGTAFCVCLPAHEIQAKKVVTQLAAPPAGKGECVLLVEDEKRVREAIGEILETLGYRVLTAKNGREALKLCGSGERIELVITDVVMPEMGGLELAQKLQEGATGAKVLALTGYTQPERLAELRQAGIPEIVKKPVEMHALAEAIRRVLSTDLVD